MPASVVRQVLDPKASGQYRKDSQRSMGALSAMTA
ncbi:hypothetical protein OKW35_009900 [Paraburkholderia sp. MM5477-R1]